MLELAVLEIDVLEINVAPRPEPHARSVVGPERIEKAVSNRSHRWRWEHIRQGGTNSQTGATRVGSVSG
ncbi:MAG TPA: hypothetical protein VF989_05380, partial [Polyangiaceae bacterium]